MLFQWSAFIVRQAPAARPVQLYRDCDPFWETQYVYRFPLRGLLGSFWLREHENVLAEPVFVRCAWFKLPKDYFGSDVANP